MEHLIKTATGDEIKEGQQYWEVDDNFEIWSYEASSDCEYSEKEQHKCHASLRSALKAIAHDMPLLNMEDVKMLIPLKRGQIIGISYNWAKERAVEHVNRNGIRGTMGNCEKVSMEDFEINTETKAEEMKYRHKVSGSEAEPCQDCEGLYKVTTIKDNSMVVTHINKIFIEKTQDWEQVVEKDYEILSFVNEGGNPSSVRRLSDGQVLSNGDKISYKPIPMSTGSLRGFFIKDDRCYAVLFEGDKFAVNALLSDVIKAPSPLFTTEDGVEICGDTNYAWIDGSGIIHTNKTDKRDTQASYERSKIKRFSTKEAAEEYLEKEKKASLIEKFLSEAGYKPTCFGYNKALVAMGGMYDTLTKQK